MSRKRLINAVALVFWMAPIGYLLYHLFFDGDSGDFKRDLERMNQVESTFFDWWSLNALCFALILLPALSQAIIKEWRSRPRPMTAYVGKCFISCVSIAIGCHIIRVILNIYG